MNIYVYGTKKKRKRNMRRHLSLYFVIRNACFIKRGGGGGKEEEQKIKGKRRNTCRERDPMRVNRYIWSLP